ncbi:hypothetical protein C8R46DRAFT_1027686 [Mycena filopes]|nr:hypothetical protein C8R46DRAFT_1027686 [Mycena filopes]
MICMTTALRNSTVRTTTAWDTARKTRGKTWATILGRGCVATARGNRGERRHHENCNSARRSATGIATPLLTVHAAAARVCEREDDVDDVYGAGGTRRLDDGMNWERENPGDAVNW